MAEFKGLVDRIITEEDGQGMIEYALIAALIAVVLIAALTTLSGTGGIGGTFTRVSTALSSAGS